MTDDDDPSPRRSRLRTYAALSAFVIAVVIFPVLAPERYPLGLGIVAGSTTVATVGLALLLGLARQLAVGQGAFCMIGGYASAILCATYGWDPLAAMLVGAAISMAVAFALGRPILKLRGYVLAMASLALHLMLIVAAIELPVTGGAMGVIGIPRFAVLGYPLTSNLAYYFFVWFIALNALIIGLNIERSRTGRALRAIAANETAAGSVAIDIAHYKMQMFVVSAALASISGSLTTHFLRAMDPTVFGFNYDLNLLTAVVVGGVGTTWGGAIGAAAILGVRELLRDLGLPLWEAVIMGSVTVLVLTLFPQGVVGLVRRAFPAPASTHAGAATPDLNALPPFPRLPKPSSEILRVMGAARSFGSLKAVAGVSFEVEHGSVTALIGPNGAGKTTMFNLICGQTSLDEGVIMFRDQRIERLRSIEIARRGIGRTFQTPQLFENMSVLENVMCGRHRLTTSGLVPIMLHFRSVRREEGASREEARRALQFVGLQPFENAAPTDLSFGHQRMLEIARGLALKPSLLLMDEPASGLNDSETERLAELIVDIGALGVTVLLIEHDMRLVMGLADRIVVMNHGEKIADGLPDMIRRDAAVIDAYLGAGPDAAAA